MLPLFFQNISERPVLPTLLFYVFPISLLAGAALREILRKKWAAGLVYFCVLSGWSAHAILEHGAEPFDPNKLPRGVYIPQPDSLSLEHAAKVIVVDREVLKTLSPSKLSWRLDGTEREFSFNYGYIPEAYQTGNPDGAEFIVEISDGTTTRLVFHRLLLPMSRPADREFCFSRVILPPTRPGSHLSLRLEPGPSKNDAWDWLFVANVKFYRHPRYLPSQFPLFSRAPDQIEAPFSFLYQKDGVARFLQLDAPSDFSYVLDGSERRLSFSYGFLSGAYQNGGGTDGAIFRVTLESPGRPPRVLFERMVQPASVMADRGPQHADLLLPAGEKGTRLHFAISPGPSDNRAWDWTYINRLTLE